MWPGQAMQIPGATAGQALCLKRAVKPPSSGMVRNDTGGWRKKREIKENAKAKREPNQEQGFGWHRRL